MARPDWMQWMLPLPRGMEMIEGAVQIDGSTRIVAPAGADGIVLKGAQQIRDDIKAWSGADIKIVPPNEPYSGSVIAIGCPSQNPVVKETLDKSWVKGSQIGSVTRSEPAAEGYLLRTFENTCVVAGADDAGTYHGVQTLRQILRGTSGKAIPGVIIWDWPCFPIRVMHMMCPRRSNLKLTEQALETLALWKMNTLLLSFEYAPNFPFEGFDSIVDPEETLTREEHAAFAARCRDLGLRVIPLVPSFGHLQGFLFKGADWDDILEKHPDPSSLPRPYHRERGNYCPSNPRTYEIFFDLFDQVLDAYPSDYLHIGHDELDDGAVGVCPRCNGVSTWELLAEDLHKIHDRMTVRKGVRLMMWPDMIIPYFRGGPRTGGKNVHPHMFMHFGIDHLPKDIIMTDWEYTRRSYYLSAREAPEGSYPSTRYLLDHGFTVLPFGWDEPRSVMLLAQSAWKNSRLDWLPPGKGGPTPALNTGANDVIGFGGCTWGHLAEGLEVVPAHAAVAAFGWNPNQTCAELPEDCRQFMADTMSWRK